MSPPLPVVLKALRFLFDDRLGRGDVPLALTVYGFLAEQGKRKGAAIDWFVIPHAIARPSALGVARNAPHPHAAVLFHDFLIGEGQQILAGAEYLPVRPDVDPQATIAPIVPARAGVRENFVTPENLNSHTERSAKIVQELFR